jgi:D-alanyl-D-alanine carboxypeptidase
MLEQCFSQYTLQPILSRGDQVAAVEVAGSAVRQVTLLADADIVYPLAREEKLKLVVPGTGFVYAPVAQGQSAGAGYLCLGDQAVIKVPLVYGETAERKIDPARPRWQRLFGGIQE